MGETVSKDGENEREGLAHFFRCVQTGGGWTFEVGLVEWLSSYETSLVWKTFRTWKREPSPDRLLAARAAATKRFFRACTRGHELFNLGHMNDRSTCQGCAERFLGVVY